MLLIEYVGHIGLRSLTGGHLGRHLEYFKTLNDARVASVGFMKYNALTTRINKQKNFKTKFQVNLVFYQNTLKYHAFDNIMDKYYGKCSICMLLIWSKCSIFHNIFKTIQNLTYIFLEFFLCCLKIENDAMI